MGGGKSNHQAHARTQRHRDTETHRKSWANLETGFSSLFRSVSNNILCRNFQAVKLLGNGASLYSFGKQKRQEEGRIEGRSRERMSGKRELQFAQCQIKCRVRQSSAYQRSLPNTWWPIDNNCLA